MEDWCGYALIVRGGLTITRAVDRYGKPAVAFFTRGKPTLGGLWVRIINAGLDLGIQGLDPGLEIQGLD